MEFDELQGRYNTLANDALRLCFLVRDQELQEKVIVELDEFLPVVRASKARAIRGDQEELANVLFYLQCMLNSICSYLRMWVRVKSGKLEDAWTLLVDAQEYALVAARVPIPPVTTGLAEYIQRLSSVEGTVFPDWSVFLSSGFIEDGSGMCSICGKGYSDCLEHIEGYVYSGRLCDRVNRKPLVFDHGAIVESPRDRRCIIRYKSTDDGFKQDNITLRVLEEKYTEKDGKPSEGNRFEGIMFTTKRLDFA